MENSVNQRVGIAVQNSGYKSVNAFCKATGISQPTLSGVIRDNTRETRVSFLVDILNAIPKLSAKWLLKGEGAMFEEAKSGNVQIGTGNTMAGGDVRSEGGSVEVALLKKEIECLRGENERLMELIKMMRR